jgi:hypothetical protein
MEDIDEYANVPQSILEASFQPTARGGHRHYISGNIRIVNYARFLLREEKRREILLFPDPWMELNMKTWREDVSMLWKKHMEYEFNFDDKAEEPMILKGQLLFACPNCGPSYYL